MSQTVQPPGDLAALLRSRGLRATQPRLQVLSLLSAQRQPISHEAVVANEAVSRLDRVTIWRVLSDLSAAGILRRIDPGDRVWRYELVAACPLDAEHAHFLCETCRMVSCLPPLVLQTRDGQPLPMVLQGGPVGLRLVGRCLSCGAL